MVSAGLSGMLSPNNNTADAQASKHQAGSSIGSLVTQQSTEGINHQHEVQIKPQRDLSRVKSAKCELFPLAENNRVVVDFWNWDPEKDGDAQKFERCVREKCGKDNVAGFSWRKYDSEDTPHCRFTFNVPYPAVDRMNGDMYELISDAVFEYTGDAKIREPCYVALS